MSLMPFALIAGVVVGLVTRGRFSNLGDRTFSLWPVLLLGAVIQLVAQSTAAGERSYALVATSFSLLALFAAANLRYAGMGVVLVGLLMNVATIAVNRGMPVSPTAIVASGIVDSGADVAQLDLKAKRHVMTGEDTLYWLSDIVPVRLLGGQVLSFGDLVMSVGVADLIAHLLHPFPRRRRARLSRLTEVQALDGGVDDSSDDQIVDLRALESAATRA